MTPKGIYHHPARFARQGQASLVGRIRDGFGSCESVAEGKERRRQQTAAAATCGLSTWCKYIGEGMWEEEERYFLSAEPVLHLALLG